MTLSIAVCQTMPEGSPQGILNRLLFPFPQFDMVVQRTRRPTLFFFLIGLFFVRFEENSIFSEILKLHFFHLKLLSTSGALETRFIANFAQF